MKLALGTVQFGLPYGISNVGGKVMREDVKRILTLSRESGIDTLDTAIAYGNSEASLGAAGIEGFNVITKLPTIPESVQDVSRWVRDEVHASLHRMGLQMAYGLLMHQPKQLLGLKGRAVVQALERLKVEGLIQKIGVSIYSPTELNPVLDVCQIDLVQAPFNLIDQRLNTTGWLQKLHDAGVEVHTRSIFLQGLLLMPSTMIPEKFQPWSELWNTWHEWLANHPFSAAQACICFVKAFPQIDRMVVGVESVEQLRQLIDAEKKPFDAEFPDIMCTDERLINPTYWNLL
jgi:aryl-alcohol dehydrogenase-like predicted oxidoreductase